MSEIPTQDTESRAVFVEVPKPVNQMSKAERDSFVEEILKALEEQR